MVRPGGHGTRVAGAVLYPREVPKVGTAKAVAWLQNARINGGLQPGAELREGIGSKIDAPQTRQRILLSEVSDGHARSFYRTCRGAANYRTPFAHGGGFFR